MRLCVALLTILSMAHGQQIIDPPEFSGQPKKPRKPPSQVQLAFINSLGSLDATKIGAILPKVSAFIETHPTYADAYMFRLASQYCELKQPANESMFNDLAMGIQYFEKDGMFGDLAEEYGMKARLEYDLGRFQQAVDDLERGIKIDPGSAGEVVKTSGVKIETRAETEDPCSWSQTEFDNLAKRFPKDYRIPLFHGVYLSKLALLTGEELSAQAIQDFQKALVLNQKSALAHYFIGGRYSHAAFFSKEAIQSDDAKNALWKRAVIEYTTAISLDAALKQAYANRADCYLNLKQFQAAIRDYDKVIDIDPNDAGAFHDRALAKDELGNSLAAIYDFDQAIKLDTLDDSGLPNAYENRAGSHVKVGHYKEAIADFSALIRLRLESASILMSLKQFRGLYPEYLGLSDAAYLDKIHDLYWPQYEKTTFVKTLTENKDYTTFLLTDAYEERSDAYLRNVEFRKALADYHRAVFSSGDDGKFIDRWRSIGKSANREQFVDFKTLELGQVGKIWLKTMKPKGYDLDAMEVDCKAKRIRTVSAVAYDDEGKIIDSTGASGWDVVIPDTLGENLHNGMCKAE